MIVWDFAYAVFKLSMARAPAGNVHSGSRTGVRIVIAGDRGTGKSSLIVTAAADNFPVNVPPVLPPTRLPEDFYPDRVPTTIIDTSSRYWLLCFVLFFLRLFFLFFCFFSCGTYLYGAIYGWKLQEQNVGSICFTFFFAAYIFKHGYCICHSVGDLISKSNGSFLRSLVVIYVRAGWCYDFCYLPILLLLVEAPFFYFIFL